MADASGREEAPVTLHDSTPSPAQKIVQYAIFAAISWTLMASAGYLVNQVAHRYLAVAALCLTGLIIGVTGSVSRLSARVAYAEHQRTNTESDN